MKNESADPLMESRFEFKSIEEKELFELMMDKNGVVSQNIADIILTIEGFKPVSSFSSLDDTWLIEEALSGLGLYVKTKTSKYDSRILDFSISMDEDLADEYLDFCARPRKTVQYFYDTAQFFSYPKTAVDGFVKEERMEYEDLPKEIIDSEFGRFISFIKFFILSRDHWREELALIKTWVDYIKEEYPSIYKMILIESYLDEIQDEDIAKHMLAWDKSKKTVVIKKFLQIPLEDLNIEKIKEIIFFVS